MENYQDEYISLYDDSIYVYYVTGIALDTVPPCSVQPLQLYSVILSNLFTCFVGGSLFGSTIPLPTSSSDLRRCPPLTAVALIRLVITVCIAIAAPARIDAQATVTHELPRTAGLVGGWGNTTNLCL